MAASCLSAGDYETRADRAVGDVLSEDRYASLSERPSTAAYPDVVERVEQEQEVEVAVVGPDEHRVLTLAQALEISIQSGRDYIDQKESLYLSALSLTGTRHAYSPLLSTVLSYAFGDGTKASGTHTSGLTAGVTQILPWGADLSLDLSSGFSELEGTTGSFSGGAGIRYSQPLLRGAGAAISNEPLIQAERSLMYSVRSFERFRESYAIDVSRRYYDLVESKQSVDNRLRSLGQLGFGRRQAEAKFSLGEIMEVEVLRARRSELSAENDLLQAEESLGLELDEFRVFLGLPDTVAIDIVPDAPEFVPVAYDVDSAVEVALLNRLDYLSEKEQLEDSERGLAIVRDALRPSLGLSTGFDVTSGGGKSFTGQGLGTRSWDAALTLEIPVDQMDERNAYRRAQIGHAQALRQFEEFEDNLVVSLRNRFRSLRRIELSLDIQRESIRDEMRNEAIAKIWFERGEISNRDVVEAQESLLEAQNAFVNEQVNYEIERLNLLRDMGILFIDENGMWTE